jgi:hypothetical protein
MAKVGARDKFKFNAYVEIVVCKDFQVSRAVEFFINDTEDTAAPEGSSLHKGRLGANFAPRRESHTRPIPLFFFSTHKQRNWVNLTQQHCCASLKYITPRRDSSQDLLFLRRVRCHCATPPWHTLSAGPLVPLLLLLGPPCTCNGLWLHSRMAVSSKRTFFYGSNSMP